MGKLSLEKSTVDPGTPVADRLYFVRTAGGQRIKMKETGSNTLVDLDAPTLAMHALKEDKITPGTTGQYWRGDKSWQSLDKAAVGLSNVDNTSDLNKPISTATQNALNLKANDSDVVKLTGNQNIDGTKTFILSPVVPTPTVSTHSTNKQYVDNGLANLQTQLDNMAGTIGTPLSFKGTIDASTNPNYPAAQAGHTYIIAPAGGKIGGTSGDDVEVGDMIICKVASTAGNQATVGANWTIVQSNLKYATETVPGYIIRASIAEVLAGSDTTKYVSAAALEAVLNAKVVRFDVAQSLTTGQKNQVLANIGALSQSSADGRYLQLTGGNLSGDVISSAAIRMQTLYVGGAANAAQLTGTVGSTVAELNFVSTNDQSTGLLRDVFDVVFINNSDKLHFRGTNVTTGAQTAIMTFNRTGEVGIGQTSPTEKFHVVGNILATGQLKSTAAAGTAPITVVSSTLVSNLNADMVDGKHASDFALSADLEWINPSAW